MGDKKEYTFDVIETRKRRIKMNLSAELLKNSDSINLICRQLESDAASRVINLDDADKVSIKVELIRVDEVE